jgi:glucose/arabinose dehydrogenase
VNKVFILATLSVAMLLTAASQAADPPKPQQSDYYKLLPYTIPKGVVLEVGGIELMPDGRLAVSSRRGDIYMVDNPLAANPATESTFSRYADGLHEVLGLAARDGWLYATQRCEVTRIKDTSGDGRGDLFETVSDFWGINGDYHEYAFGSKFDPKGNIWVVLCLTGSGGAAENSPFRGWCMRVSADGKTVPTCSGIRSPGGISQNAVGDMFYTDNQGPWNGTCFLKWLKPGSFQGNPSGNKYYKLTDAIGPMPKSPKSGSRIMVEAKKIPELEPPAIKFPYKKMGQSASGVTCDTNGKFGPFKGQMFVGDQTHSTVMRVCMEKVRGHYQGACFPFISGVGSGTLAMTLKDGSMFIGGTNRGWGSRGSKPFSLERLDWTDKVPFEVHEMKVTKDGFLLTFTKPADPKTASDVKSYTMSSYDYIYQASYGSPVVDSAKGTIKSAKVAGNGLSVRLVVDKLHEGRIHELHMAGVRSAEGGPLWHDVGYYTLNYFAE